MFPTSSFEITALQPKNLKIFNLTFLQSLLYHGYGCVSGREYISSNSHYATLKLLPAILLTNMNNIMTFGIKLGLVL